MKRLLASALALALTTPAALANDFGPLLSPQQLVEIKKSHDPLLLDIRGVSKDGKNRFEAGHIEGSVNAPYVSFRGPQANPGQLVSEAHLEKILGAAGVSKTRPVVIIYRGANQTDFGAAARVYWTLKSSGVSQLAILNGGVTSWTDAGLPLVKGASKATPTQIDITFSKEWLATTDDVLNIIAGADKATLLDARPKDFWNGVKAHPAAAKAGTLPGSAQLAHSSWFISPTKVASADQALEIAAKAGLAKSGAPVVSFCNTGHWAATSWFALSELAGIEGVKLYPESMVGYTGAGHKIALGAAK
ncbi:MAG: sulfurtransferase [Neomegalonema sp.]|nr:sulfurtransferase [Neomegalonema sp.]